ncbi:MAG: amino acid adenylation domain-containing protein, partial [Clostridia bacterium]|nr:amino acid adenylation domain-containing protein [Clostridia bacterium]
YKELNETANRIAHGLIASGVKRGGRVALLMHRVRDAYAARQAVLKTGAAFIPIDPKYPDERMAYILDNSGAQAAVSTAELLRDKKGSFRGAAALDIEALKQTNNCENPDVPAEQTDLSYIIYTSGSTGKPKGVMITHRNLVNLCLDGSNLTTLIHRRGGDIVSGSFASLAFDASIFEEAIPLSHGYTAVIASEEEIENPLLYADMMIRYGVNMSFFTPSYVSNVLDCPPFVKALRNFKAMMMGAEAVPPELVQKLRDAGVTAEIYDGYGPTETTVACTFHRVTDKYVTIGKPVANTNIYILGTRGEIMPIGALGELTIAGECVGDGYLGMPEKTAEKFIEINGVKAFRSGDLARINAEGNVEFYGRLDNQVKLHGLRIELDEIEKAITAYPGVSRAVVAVLKSETEGDYLCGYFTAGTQIDRAKLTEFISATLTHYMVPKVLIQLEKMPLTPNGKIDKKALPEPKIEAVSRNITVPANETEAKITAIFAKALGAKEFGADENLFDRGGTSLSASKVAMLAMGQGLNIAYKDVFEFPTAQLLAKHISAASGEEAPEAAEEVPQSTEKALEYNVNRFVDEASDTRPLGRTLLTGATGFLGSHVLKELLERGVETVVLCRGSGELDARTRLSAMAAYYFDSPLNEELDRYAKIIDGDITEPGLDRKLADERINTIINCAACVKHFAKDDIIERINVGGVKNVIKLAEEKHARLVQISTLSVAGENVDNKFPPAFRMFENQLYFGQDISNKYVNSKFMAEKAVIEAAERGLDAKIIRVGNLMGRQSDGEFQINNITNSFIRSLKAYKALGCFPVSSCDTTVDFSPIDEVAKAVILLSTAGAKLTVFHCANAHEVQMGDVIEAMNRYGFEIKIVSDAEFSARLGEMMKDDSRGMLVSSLLTYSSGDRHVRSYIKTDNAFSIKALYRLGYKWPITDGDYLLRVIESLDSLNYFDREDI